MFNKATVFVAAYLLFTATALPKQSNSKFSKAFTEAELIEYLQGEYETQASEIEYEEAIAEWNYNVDVGNETKAQLSTEASLAAAAFTREIYEAYFSDLNPDDYAHNELLQRQIERLILTGEAALDQDSLVQLNEARNRMNTIYSTARICPFSNQNCDLDTQGLYLDPDLEDILATSTDYDELLHVWTQWRDASGARMRDDYRTYVDLSNQAARLNGFEDYGDMWRSDYEDDDFVDNMQTLWEQVSPLYDELHTYVLNKLKQRYPGRLDEFNGLIPAHITGNMWAQQWNYLTDLVKPFPNASAIDITSELVAQGYTPLRMFETANEFYMSLGLPSNEICYDVERGALIERPSDREVVCHASAWDFSNHVDYRIKMCTNINQEDFVTIHHEMGHIAYYIQYTNQPVTLRGGANPGFHEAIGDTIALSVNTPAHLQKVGLLQNFEESEESSLNTLMDMALDSIAFLPFGYLIDKWRWDVFSGAVPEEEWNARWWYYRETIQKIAAPVNRTEEDFDPGAKFHVPGDSQYIAYFVARLLEFQFYKALCIEAGEYNPDDPNTRPLHQCDFYQSTAAGDKLKAGLQLGATTHWVNVLQVMTGETTLNGDAILEYFDPLYRYLVEQNAAAVPDPGGSSDFLKVSHLLLFSSVVLLNIYFSISKNRL